MDNSLFKLDLDTLKNMHEKEAAELKVKLLNGALWHEVSEQKNRLIDISIAIHKITSQKQNKTSGSVSQTGKDVHPQ